jgi:hypothetical protein
MDLTIIPCADCVQFFENSLFLEQGLSEHDALCFMMLDKPASAKLKHDHRWILAKSFFR